MLEAWDDEESCELSACLACDAPVGTCCPHCEVHHPPQRGGNQATIC